MSYIIISPRIGTPGEPLIERPGINIEALLAGGFIKQSDKKTQKPATIKSKKPKE